MNKIKLGNAIPETPHGNFKFKTAISVSLPTWKDNVGYEEGDISVVSAMKSGYPRFVFHPHIKKIFSFCRERFAKMSEDCLVLDSKQACVECRLFMRRRAGTRIDVRIVEFIITSSVQDNQSPVLNVVVFGQEYAKIAKEFWQHTGSGITSRYAEHCLLKLHVLFPSMPAENKSMSTSSSRSFKTESKQHDETVLDNQELNFVNSFVEERFGRNLHSELRDKAGLILKKRIAGVVGEYGGNYLDDPNKSHDTSHIQLFSSGMAAIYFAHKIVTKVLPDRKTVQFGFPYIDTLKIQEKFGTGVHFFGNGDLKDLESLGQLLQTEQIAALFCEFPSNPLLKSPPLEELWLLSNRYNFCIVVDDTIGNFVNTNVLPHCDIIVSSLTKVFSGDSNVMGGSMVLNPHSKYFNELFKATQELYIDTTWDEDIIFLERNSRTFKSRILTINKNTQLLCNVLKLHPKVKQIFYPKYTTTEQYLKHCIQEDGFGGLFSIVLENEEMAEKFYDLLPIHKGPSLGTNFTLACPYTILAHYYELDWALAYGVPKSLIRVSVGLENPTWLVQVFTETLNAI